VTDLAGASVSVAPDPDGQLARIRSLRSCLDLPDLDPDEIGAAIDSGRP
jgi:hypothetical protein